MTRNEDAACDRVIEVMRRTLVDRALAGADNAVLLMVSGGSDSTALAYAAAELQAAGALGALAMLHVNHKLRGRDSDDDAQFVATLAEALGIPLFMCEIDVAGEVAGLPMCCMIGGVLRGILPEGTQVHKGMKSGDVDPRGQVENCYTASDKALAVGGGVLEAILHLSGILRREA